MPQRARIAATRVVVAIATGIVVLVAAVAGIVVLLSPSTGVIVSSPTTSSYPSPVLSSSSTQATSSSHVTVDSSLGSYCPSGPSNGTTFIDLVTGTGSPAVFCLEFYYYNSFEGYNASSPVLLNVSSVLSIQAVQEVLSDGLYYPQTFDGSQNFTVEVSQSQLAIGGPGDENEGAMVAYAVTSGQSASGTYQLGLSPPGSAGGMWLLGPQQPDQCGYYGRITAGSGQPNYAQDLGGCITYATTPLSSSTTSLPAGYHVLPGVPYPLLIGNVYFRIISITNSTG